MKDFIGVEEREGHHIVVRPDGTCRPATDVEKDLYSEVERLDAEVKRLNKVVEAAEAVVDDERYHTIHPLCWKRLKAAVAAHRGEAKG